MKKFKIETFFAYLFLTIGMLACVVPLLIIISASFTPEKDLITSGYSVLPKNVTLDAYKYVFSNASQLKNAYFTTIAVTLIGTVCALFLTSITAYPLSRNDFVWKKKASLYFYFTILFSGGMIPSYILISQYLKMGNRLIVLIVPLMMSVWNMLVLRTYFSQVSPSVIESAKIDGASEYRTFFSIVLPMSQVGIATIGFLICMGYWNDWYLCFMYMTNSKYISLQYFLYQTMSNIETLLKYSNTGTVGTIDISTLPSESVRMAMCVLAVGPMLFVFMFFQKYFAKGISIGAVKG